MRETVTSVRTPAGDLRAIVRHPDLEGPLPGVVLVDGALEGTADGWGQFPAALVGFGAAVLSHDKPGCGGSPGDWREQTFDDRARESLAAAEVLRAQPGVDRARIGLLGVSQGGWVSLIAASLEPAAVSHVVTISGPGVSAVEQERYRLESAVAADAEAMAWVDERVSRLLGGEDPASILARQAAYSGRPWYPAVSLGYDEVGFLAFIQRIGAFDPGPVLPKVQCPVFGAFGGADSDVPAQRSVAAFASLLPANPRHALAVFAGADHGLVVDGQDRSVPLADRLAPGFLPMLEAWLHAT
jgi:pimeloyl-ACP methyl ester carboxylesterase